MRFSTAITLALTILLATSAIGPVIAAPSSQSPTEVWSPPQQITEADELPPLEPAEPRQVIRINVTDSGDAEWTIESRFLVEDDDDVERFSAFADAVTSGERSVGYNVHEIEHFVTEAERSTAREMEIVDTSWNQPRIENLNESTEVGDEPINGADDELAEANNDTQVGIISYSFTWTEFTTVTDNRIYLGDAFQTNDGTWFPSLVKGQQLVVEWPENYGFDSAPPAEQENGTLVWTGPHEFSENELEIVFLRGAPPEEGFWASVSTALSPVPAPLWVGLLILLAAGGYVLVREHFAFDRASDSGENTGDSGTAVSYTDREQPAPVYDEPATAEETADEINIELLSDEERVHRMLRENGGRMKQAVIVKETGWSNAKVSQLLSKMDDDDEIEKLRIGRENLITLPEVDPTEID